MFTREKLKKLHELSDEIKRQKEIASEQLKTAQDRTGHVEHKITREGKDIMLTEKVLWDEVFFMGPNCESGQFMAKIYPEVFKAYKKQNITADEMKKFCMTEFGIDFTAMTISDYLKLTEGMFKLMMSEADAPKTALEEKPEEDKSEEDKPSQDGTRGAMFKKK